MKVVEAGAISLGLLTSPGRTLDRVALRPSVGTAAIPVVATGAAWSALCVLLWLDGHAPSRSLVPLPKESYYLGQALWLIPALLLGWIVVGGVCQLLSRWAGGAGGRASMLASAGFAYALPLAVLFVLPDFVAYLSLGFASLGKLVRFTGLGLMLAEWALVARAVVAVHRLAWSRALPIAFVALLAQAALLAPILR
ncbi:MAG: hypothetical protein HS104_25475 [Polyangiaceae bacterium]|nr:hypothetical protein [Polyangiaceae bacterium]MCE7893053.1 hypothetical protein [Sorangiineae bacterium PRO1]MCL4754004.1 hypothetical protein [Myxococcales bacterium]